MPAESSALLGNAEQLRGELLTRFAELVTTTENWAREIGWATRRIETRVEDTELGDYLAPALLLQENTTRISLQPIGRTTNGAEGIADLCLMPAYDDIARIFSTRGDWQYFHNYPGRPPGTPENVASAAPFTKDAFHGILTEMLRHATEIG